jgi:pantothenate synthetase
LRERSGLARSSRNVRLTEQGQQQASIIFRAMQAANALWRQGIRSPRLLQQAMLEIMGTSDIELEYAELRDPRNWTSYQPEHDLKQARVFVAGTIEGVRLIDNMALDPDIS